IKLINSVLLADMKNAVNDGLSVLAHLLCLVGIILLSKLTTPSLLKYAMLYTGANMIVMLVASIVLYSTLYRKIAPRISSIRIALWKDLVSVGAKFFVIQIAAVVFFQTTSFILSTLVGPESVTDYSITQKYFSMMSLGFAMLAQPLWSGFGDAYHRQDFSWVKKTIKRLHWAWLILVIGMVGMIAIQKFVFRLWVGELIEIDYALSLLFVVYISFQMWNTIYASFINSTSKLKLSLYLAILLVPPFIPGAVLLVKYMDLGAKGLLINLILLQALPAAIIGPIQTNRIINNVRGIWNQ
ncbi:MAG: oligosaccharide flippase family protein, partial [Candidatus Cloacimonadaceae bacterium]|nr:oligosaccharide flippase family protein [Candidatus Cloacimonadaceae bacterium]